MPNSPGSVRGGVPPVEDAAYEALLAGSLRPADADEGLRPLAEAVAALTVGAVRPRGGGRGGRQGRLSRRVRPALPSRAGRPPPQAGARLGARRQAGGGGGRDRRWPDRRGLRERAARPGAELRAPHRGRARAARGLACGAASHPGRAGAVRPGGQPPWPHAVRGAFAQPGWPLPREDRPVTRPTRAIPVTRPTRAIPVTRPTPATGPPATQPGTPSEDPHGPAAAAGTAHDPAVRAPGPG